MSGSHFKNYTIQIINYQNVFKIAIELGCKFSIKTGNFDRKLFILFVLQYKQYVLLCIFLKMKNVHVFKIA